MCCANRHMGKLFANFEPYDVQATRKEAKAEGRAEEMERGIERLVQTVKKLGRTVETASEQLVEQYGLNDADAFTKLKRQAAEPESSATWRLYLWYNTNFKCFLVRRQLTKFTKI